MDFLKTVFFLTLLYFSFNVVFAQEEPIVSPEDQLIIFVTSAVIVVGIFLFMARHIILRKKTPYDKSEYTSQKDRDYEKYHSDWTDEFEEIGKKPSEYEEEFKQAKLESNLPNYYKILGVSKNATRAEIKKRFRELVKQLHPDRTKNSKSKEKMAEIIKAYEVLSDNERRAIYDKYLNVS